MWQIRRRGRYLFSSSPSWIPARTHTPDNGRIGEGRSREAQRRKEEEEEKASFLALSVFSRSRERRRKRRSATFGHTPSLREWARGKRVIAPLPPPPFFPITNPIDPPLPHPQPCWGVGSSAPWMPPSPSSFFSFPFSPRGLIARGEVYRRNAFLCTHIPSHIKRILPRHLFTLRYFSLKGSSF